MKRKQLERINEWACDQGVTFSKVKVGPSVTDLELERSLAALGGRD